MSSHVKKHHVIDDISSLIKKNISPPLQDPYIFEPNCQMQVDEFGFYITWKSEGKVRPPPLHFPLFLDEGFYLAVFAEILFYEHKPSSIPVNL